MGKQPLERRSLATRRERTGFTRHSWLQSYCVVEPAAIFAEGRSRLSLQLRKYLERIHRERGDDSNARRSSNQSQKAFAVVHERAIGANRPIGNGQQQAYPGEERKARPHGGCSRANCVYEGSPGGPNCTGYSDAEGVG